MKTILVVDDEPKIVKLVSDYLENAGYAVRTAGDGRAALALARQHEPDMVVLDLGLPGMDGLDFTRELRRTSNAPIIMLTARSDESDKLVGLELGADDYVTKPFSPRELASRIRAVLRRVEKPASAGGEVVRIDDRLSVDFRQREVIVDGQRISLRPTEYRLLYHLVNNPGWIMTHEMLLSKVWGYEYRDDTQLLRLYITYLRQKIEPEPGKPRYIFTERGVGYRFVDFRQPQLPSEL
jgi:DNA-binding response OmpR family regulator